MKNNDLLRAIGQVSDEYVTEGASKIKHAKKTGLWLRWTTAAVSAALLVAFCTAVLPPLMRGEGDESLVHSTPGENADPTGQEVFFSASDIAQLFDDETRKDAATNAYKVVYAPDDTLLKLSPVVQDEILPIFQKLEREPDEAQLRAFIEGRSSELESICGLSIDIPDEAFELHAAEYSLDTRISCFIDFGEYYLNANSTGEYNTVMLSHSDSLKLDGKTLVFNDTDSDELIRESLSDTVAYLNNVFGTSFSQMDIIRGYGDGCIYYMTIYLFDAKEDTAGGICMYDTPMAGREQILRIHFSRQFSNAGTTVICKSISYMEEEMGASCHAISGYAERISLQEAQELLKLGYVFGGHSCPLCMADQADVDFSDYKYVGMEYIFGGKKEMGIPFYTFYKALGSGESGYCRYAKTYVPAIAVSELDEFFLEQSEGHLESLKG